MGAVTKVMKIQSNGLPTKLKLDQHLVFRELSQQLEMAGSIRLCLVSSEFAQSSSDFAFHSGLFDLEDLHHFFCIRGASPRIHPTTKHQTFPTSLSTNLQCKTKLLILNGIFMHIKARVRRFADHSLSFK